MHSPAAVFTWIGIEDARPPAANALAENPDFSLRRWRENLSYENPADPEHYLDGLRQEGQPH